MARVFRPEYTAPVPASASLVVRGGVRYAEYRRKGKLVRWPVRDVNGRPRMVVTVETWYCELDTHAGRTRRVKGFRDKRATEVLLLQLLREDERRRAGLRGPDLGVARQPLAALAEEYLEVLAAKGTAQGSRDNVRRHLDGILPACRWETWADVRGDDLLRFLGRLRDDKDRSPATLNSYLLSAKGFFKWLGRRLHQPSPLTEVPFYAEEHDRRRSRRILTDAEFSALLRATAADPCRRRDRVLPAADRAALYRVAAYTGLRASELAALTPAEFHLDHPTPHIRPEARDQKGRRPEAVPLPAHAVAALRPWLAAKAAGDRVWPGPWAAQKRAAEMLRQDLARAGVAEHDVRGRRATFHSLRRRYVTSLIRSAGADVDQVRRLARHRDVRTTLDYYVDADLADLGTVADRLPPPVGE